MIHRIASPALPVAEAMGGIGALALAANAVCFALLWKHRSEDINMSSVWECSRNDIASNLAVIAASLAVWATGSGWADVVVGGALAAVFLRSAWRVPRGARLELRAASLAMARDAP